MKDSKTPNIGLSEEVCQSIAEDLNRLLAATYDLYYKTHACHWNVVSLQFYALHQMLEDQYKSLAEAVDEIAERMRQLGHFPPMQLEALMKESFLAPLDPMGEPVAMTTGLLDCHEKLIQELRKMIEKTELLEDAGTADFFVERLRYHEKTAWMLRSGV